MPVWTIWNKENFLENTWQWSTNQVALVPCKKMNKVDLYGAAALKILTWVAWSSHVAAQQLGLDNHRCLTRLERWGILDWSAHTFHAFLIYFCFSSSSAPNTIPGDTGGWSRMMESSVLLQQLQPCQVRALSTIKVAFPGHFFTPLVCQKWLKGCAVLWNYRTALWETQSRSVGAVITSQENLFGSTKERWIPPSSLGRKMDYSSCNVQSRSAFPDEYCGFL